MPRITIVTPSYNNGPYLEDTIRSVLNQNYPNLEYIIIDGGSTDGSVDIIKKYQERLAFWKSEPDGGMYDAIQQGFSRSTGEIMGWLNADDIFHEGCFSILGQVFSDFAEVNWIQGIPNVLDEKGRTVYIPNRHFIDKYFLYGRRHIRSREYIPQESTFWRRKLWEKSGGRVSQDYKHAGDFELWIRFFECDRLFRISALLGAFRLRREGQASITYYQEYVNETLDILRKHPLKSEERQHLRRIERFEKFNRGLVKVGKLFGLKGFDLVRRQPSVNLQFDYLVQKFNMR